MFFCYKNRAVILLKRLMGIFKNAKKKSPRNVIKTTFLGYYYKLTDAAFHLVRD